MEILSPETVCIHVGESTMVAEARRRTATLAAMAGFSDTRAGELAIVTTELATNLLKHAGGGELYAVAVATPAGAAIDLLAVDRGPGMLDLSACMRDGYSTAGSPGTGLGALSRLATTFDAYSVSSRSLRESAASAQGTAIHVRLYAHEPPTARTAPPFDIFGLCLPYPGQTVTGDAWAYRAPPGACTVLVVDGLGHGASAAEASHEALAAFERSREGQTPSEILEDLHHALRATRGAVAGVAHIDFERGMLSYGGIGNIAAMIVNGAGTRRLLSHNGTLGGVVSRFRHLEYPFADGAILVMSSDGLASSIDVAKHPGLVVRTPPVIAGTLMREYRRERDDATVVVLRQKPRTA